MTNTIPHASATPNKMGDNRKAFFV